MSISQSRRDYMAYKRVCAKADEELKTPEELSALSIEQLEKYYNELLLAFVYTEKCYKRREEFREKHIPIQRRDEPHEHVIREYKKNAQLLQQRMSSVVQEIQSRQVSSPKQSAPVTKSKTEDPRRKSKSKKKSKSRGRATSALEPSLDSYIETATLYEQQEEEVLKQEMKRIMKAMLDAGNRLKSFFQSISRNQRFQLHLNTSDTIYMLSYYTQMRYRRQLDSFSIRELNNMTVFDSESTILSAILSLLAKTREGIFVVSGPNVYNFPMDYTVNTALFNINTGIANRGLISTFAKEGDIYLGVLNEPKYILDTSIVDVLSIFYDSIEEIKERVHQFDKTINDVNLLKGLIENLPEENEKLRELYFMKLESLIKKLDELDPTHSLIVEYHA